MPSRFEIDDALWAEVEALIPARVCRHRYPGRKALSGRLALNGILHVLHTGIAWRDVPQEYGYGSGVTCWRRLRDWQAAGVWDALHERLLIKLNDRVQRHRASKPRLNGLVDLDGAQGNAALTDHFDHGLDDLALARPTRKFRARRPPARRQRRFANSGRLRQPVRGAGVPTCAGSFRSLWRRQRTSCIRRPSTGHRTEEQMPNVRTPLPQTGSSIRRLGLWPVVVGGVDPRVKTFFELADAASECTAGFG